MNSKAQIFNSSAEVYDQQFTHSAIGKLQRERVFHFLLEDDFLSKPKSILELNCGTGEDAKYLSNLGHHVIATDESEQMLNVARAKFPKGLDFKRLDFSKKVKEQELKDKDLVFSNFGGLNCIDAETWKCFAEDLSALEKRSRLALVIMPKKCWIESLYFIIKGNKKASSRRNTNEAVSVNVNGEKVSTYYYSPKEICKVLASNFVPLKVRPIGFFLPPSYLQPFFNRNKSILKILALLEKIFSRFTWMANWSDHYLIIAERK